MKHKRIISLSLMFALSAGVFTAFAVAPKAGEPAVAFATYTNHDAGTYYNSLDESKNGNDFLKDLRSLNLSKRKSTVGYNAMGTTPSGQFKYTDYDPNYVKYDSNNQPYGTRISSFYTYTSATSWNREHVWPNSHGGGEKGDVASPYVDADIHMPRPTVPAENSSRGNSFFVEGMNSDKDGWDPFTAGYSKDSRGEAARITFYCTLTNENLILASSNKTPSGVDPISGKAYGSGHTMGNLITLIKWNLEHPVTQREKNRNEGAEYLQGNRNPFVDHPEYVCKIWGNANAQTKALCSGQKVTMSQTSVTTTVGKTISIYATTSDASEITWTSSDESVVTLNKTKTAPSESISLTTVGNGTSTITAKIIVDAQEYTAECKVTVKEDNLSSITLSGSYPTEFNVGDTFSYEGLVVTANYSVSGAKVVTDYSVSTPDMSTTGNKTVTVTYTDNGVTKTATYTINVSTPVIHVTSISLNKTELTLKVGETYQLVATVSPDNADDKEVTWSPLSHDIAKVSTTGKVTAKAIGTVTVTATTVDGGLSASCTVKVVSGGASSGCGGNIVTTSIVLSTLSALGIGLLLIKRKFIK